MQNNYLQTNTKTILLFVFNSNKMNKYVKWGIIGVVVLGFAGLGIYNFVPRENSELKEAPQKQKGKDKTLNVRYTVLKEQTLSDGIYVSGTLNPDEEVDLSFESPGKITNIYFKEGARVAKGTLLAKINDAPLQAQLRKLQAQLKLMQDRLYRQRALLEKEAVSKESFQEAEANLSTRRAEIDMVKAEIEQTELRAPFDGVIGLRQVSVGAYATTSTTVATLTKMSPLKVEFSIPERYAGELRPGAKLTFTAEGDLTPREAVVYATAAQVNTDTRTYTVRARYANADGKLVPGRYVNVNLVAREYGRTLAVPSEALVSEMGVDKVFLCKNGTAVPVEIKKGLRTDSQVQVLSGVSVGDTVIISGTMQLRTGQKVKLTR
ncbi:efflux pump periplasmic linker BepF [Bacteroidaceae bacterium]|nr:efflux pump periplasmic linker BepF [Bacteroidaceae bacterium]